MDIRIFEKFFIKNLTNILILPIFMFLLHHQKSEILFVMINHYILDPGDWFVCYWTINEV